MMNEGRSRRPAEPPSRPKKPFHLNMEAELKQIPDYTQGSYRSTAVRRTSVFAKIMLAVIIIGISVFLALLIIFSGQEIFGINKPDQTILVDIPQNSGVQQIAEVLEQRGVIKSAYLFRVYYKVARLNGNFQYGTYSLNTKMSYDAIVNELSKYSSSREEVTVMFPEGCTLYEMSLLLEENQVCKSEDFLAALQNNDFGFDFEKEVSSGGKKYHRFEGYAFPDTYNFYVNDNPVNVAKKLLSNFNRKLRDEYRQRMKELGLTLEQGITLASIVQGESGDPDQMKMVASVYLNRINNAGTYPRLQADPTRKYAASLRNQMDIIDESIALAYDTYESDGLPPGPINNPGLAAIDAALNPTQTDYFYFCTDLKTGQFYYAKTLAEHEQNLRKAGLT